MIASICRFGWCIALAVTILPLQADAADSSAATVAEPHHPITMIAAQAKAAERAIAAEGATVAIVGRIGRDPAAMPAGMRFTHVGFWVYSAITPADDPKGPPLMGYAAYNLYQEDKEPDRSRLVQDFPVDFMLPAYDLSVGLIIPKPEVQEALQRVILSPAYARLHNPRYSVIANPAVDRYQNCTAFVLDVLFAGLYETEDKRQIKANIAAYFRPQAVAVSGGKRLLASLFVREVATADHGPEIRTATFETIAAFMRDRGLSERSFEIAGARPGRV